MKQRDYSIISCSTSLPPLQPFTSIWVWAFKSHLKSSNLLHTLLLALFFSFQIPLPPSSVFLHNHSNSTVSTQEWYLCVVKKTVWFIFLTTMRWSFMTEGDTLLAFLFLSSLQPLFPPFPFFVFLLFSASAALSKGWTFNRLMILLKYRSKSESFTFLYSV